MAELVLVVDGGMARCWPINAAGLVVGRSSEVDVSIDDVKLSRRHVRLTQQEGRYYVEDLGSRNGTFLNNRRLSSKVVLRHNDLLCVGSQVFRFHQEKSTDNEMTITRQTHAIATNDELFREHSSAKLRAVLDLSHQLARALDTDAVLATLLDQLMILFPRADRAQAIFSKENEFVIRAFRVRVEAQTRGQGFSRSVVRKVVQQRLAVLAEDTRTLESTHSISGMGIHSLMAVPLLTRSGDVIGVIGLDRYQPLQPFSGEDLHLLTAVVLQASAAMENAALHEALLAKVRIDGELKLAREIQDGFLPLDLPSSVVARVELFGDLQPAHEIAGDFYDYLVLDGGRIAFVVADVSGKGMPAALFMATVRALIREWMQSLRSPAQILAHVNEALMRNNPKYMFVTAVLGIYEPSLGQALLARAGHPPAVLRRRDGTVVEIDSPSGSLLGIENEGVVFSEVSVSLEPADTLVMYTDGLTESVAPDAKSMFGTERLLECLQELPSGEGLKEWGQRIRKEVEAHAASHHLQDDLTLLLLRRPS